MGEPEPLPMTDEEFDRVSEVAAAMEKGMLEVAYGFLQDLPDVGTQVAALGLALSHTILQSALDKVPQEGMARVAYVRAVIDHVEQHLLRSVAKRLAESPEIREAVLRKIMGKAPEPEEEEVKH